MLLKSNKELARLFKEMAAMYSFLNMEDRFRVLAYSRASRIIGGLDFDIGSYNEKEMEAMKGIGHGIATKISEYLSTGAIKKYDELKAQVPHNLIPLIDVKGFGPQSLKTIHNELGISNSTELKKALKDGSILKLKGFGIKKVRNMLNSLTVHRQVEDRILLWDALILSDKIIDVLQKIQGVEKAEVAGSIRRRKETIGDIDILISCAGDKINHIVDQFAEWPEINEVISRGRSKVSVIVKEQNRRVDILLVRPFEWGSAMVYFTGSKQHNIVIRRMARSRGMKINEYGVFDTETNIKVAGKTEKEVYDKLDMQWMPPEMREENGEIEAALNHNIKELVSMENIKGDLQMHSNWSDGMYTIEEIANYVRKKFSYEYIAITDHTKSVKVAGGMNDEEFLKQIEEIRSVNDKLGKIFIKAGAEVDILPDGSLDLSNEVLGQLDWVVASIHTNFNRDNTERLIKACYNPYVHVIGHPTGRMIGLREAYKADIDQVITAARDTGTVLEINAQPERMDLNDEFCRKASEKGVMLVINTDSHILSNLNYMKIGVSIARRAWCTKQQILNTLPWQEVVNFFSKKRKSIPAKIMA